MADRKHTIAINRLIDSPYQGRFLGKEVLSKKPYSRKQLQELSNSIHQSGILQPILVKAVGRKYEIIDGHRRVEACRLLGIEKIPALIKEGTDKEIQLMSIAANLQRSELSNLEKAMAFEKILSVGLYENKKELSKAIGKDDTYVNDIMNLLKMDKRIISDLSKGNRLKDLRMLRMIRNVEKINSEGISDKQYTLYLECIAHNYNRDRLKQLLMKQEIKGKGKVDYKLTHNKNGLSVRFTGFVGGEKKKNLLELLEKKIAEVIKETGEGDI